MVATSGGFSKLSAKQMPALKKWSAGFCLVGLSVVCLQGGAAPDWENEQVIQMNREPARATFVPFGDVAGALAGAVETSPYFLSLNGTWKFNWVPNPDARPTNFFQTNFDDSAWQTIDVPSCVEMKGHGTPIYVSSGYPFKIDPPRVMGEPPTNYTSFKARNPVSSYRRSFELPANWNGRRVFIHFDGVESAFYIWVNGVRVGYSQNSRSPAEFDLTDFLKPGANQLAVEVYRWSDGSYLEDQDMWRMSGIFRDVYLYSTATARIRDFAVRTELDADYRHAVLQIKPLLADYAHRSLANWTVRAQLFDAENHPVFKSELSHDAAEILNRDWNAKILDDRTPQRGPVKFAWLEAVVKNPAKWTAETPNLYTLVLTLNNELGEVVEADRCAVGFREIEIRGGQFLVNGRPIRLRGVNRHETDPDTGHTVSSASMVRDIELMKRANINAVRTCHYPDDPRWYELCDRYGLYVMDEANLEAQGTRGFLANDPRWHNAFLDRAISLAERDKNHPSVIMWSLGNESGYGPNFAAMSGWLHTFDPTRPVHYEGAQGGKLTEAARGFQPTSEDVASNSEAQQNAKRSGSKSVLPPPDPPGVDVISRFYPRVMEPYAKPESPENTRWEHLLEIAQRTNDTRPVLTSEFAHVMGNSLGNFQEYWDEIYSHPRLLGGFIWEWSDQGLRKTAPDGTKSIAYGGDFGDAPNLGIFCIKGIVDSDRGIYPKYWEVKKVYQPVAIEPVNLKPGRVVVKVTNRNSFLNLNEFEARWSVTCGSNGVLQSGVLAPLDCPPGKSVEVRLPVEKIHNLEPGAECWLRVSFHTRQDAPWAMAGHEVAWQQMTLMVSVARERPPTKSKKDNLNLIKDGDAVRIEGTNFSVAFSRAAGTLTSLNFGGQEMLVPGGTGLRPVVAGVPPETLGEREMALTTERHQQRTATNEIRRDAGFDGRDARATHFTPNADELAGPVLQMFRAPTDNDKGFGRWLARDWRLAGLDHIVRRVDLFNVVQTRSDEVKITTVVTSSVTNGGYKIFTTWTVRGDGTVDMNNRFEPFGQLPPALPRVGVVLRVAGELEQFTWQGRGPFENYSDRKQAADLGVWSGSVTDQFVPYVRPQENGNKEDVRWLALADARGVGLRVSSEWTPISVSALHFTAADLMATKHNPELKPRPEVVLSLDVKNSGLGNGSCGPGVLERYAVPPQIYRLSLRFEQWNKTR